VTTGVTYRHPSVIGGEAGQELVKALAVFYTSPRLSVVDGTTFVSISEPTDLSPAGLEAIVRHFLRGRREQSEVELRPLSSYRPPLAASLTDDRSETGPGIYLAGPQWTSAKAWLRRQIVGMLPARVGATFLEVPSQISEDVLVRAGYFEKFPHLVSAIGHLRPEYWDQVTVSALRREQTSARRSFYETSNTVLNPVTCYHVYSNAHTLQRQNNQSNGLFAIEGSVFRHEGRSLGPTRLSEFTMFELVKMGTVPDVEDSAEAFRLAFEHFFDQLSVPYRIVSASDAFFGDEPSLRRSSQLRSHSKYEIRIPMADGELSVASINRHSDSFVEPFGLQTLGVEATCCAGIGIDRLLSALQAYGLAPT